MDFIKKNIKKIEEMINDPLYKIFRSGCIKTLITINGKISAKKEWRLAGTVNRNGYMMIKHKNHPIAMHRIIYRKFIGVLDPGLTINHIDGNKTNNNYKNLEQVSMKEQCFHRFRVLKHKPSKYKGKLTFELAEKIREDYEGGIVRKILMDKYKISKTTVHDVISGKTWKSN